LSRLAQHPPGKGRVDVPPCWPEGPARPLQRPTAPAEPQDSYRGQQKGPTVNNRLVSTATGHMCFLRATYDGQGHANSLAALDGSTLPGGRCLDQERGGQGFLLDEIPLVQPKKHPRGGDLTPSATAPQRAMASIRIRIAHAMGGVKRDRIVHDKTRLLQDGIRDTLMETGCGLHTCRLQDRPWNCANE
jgi:DDE superfamily endonuclease